jgi:hypothetical protein
MLTPDDCAGIAAAIRSEFNRVWPPHSALRTVFELITDDRNAANPLSFRGAVSVSITNIGTDTVAVDGLDALSSRGDTITLTTPFENTVMVDAHTVVFGNTGGTKKVLVVSQFLVPI